MFKCPECSSLMLENNSYTLIGKCTKTNKPERVVICCDCCGFRHVTGGEPDYEYFDGKPCIMGFGEDFNPEKHKDLPYVYGILHFTSTSVDKAEYAIVGHHENLGSGILGWYKMKCHALIAHKNMLKDRKRIVYTGKVVTKENALN